MRHAEPKTRSTAAIVMIAALSVAACGGTSAGRSAIDEAIEDQGEVYAAYARAQFERYNGNYEAAVTYAGEAVAIAPNDPVLILTLGEMLRLNLQYAEAAEVLERGIGNVADSRPLWLELATVQEHLDQHEAAEASYQNAISLAPAEFESYLRYAGFASRVQTLDRAVEIVLGFVAVHDDDAEAWRTLAQIYEDAERFGDALEAFQTAADIEPIEESDYVPMIRLAREVGDEDLGRSLATECFRVYRRNVACRVEFIKMLDSLALEPEDRQTEVIEVLRTLGRAIGANFGRLRRVERTLVAELSAEDALTFLGTMAADRPRNSQIQSMAAWAAYRVEDEELACEYMSRVLEVNPNSADALNFIGYSYAERAIRLDEAEELILRALDIRPTDGNIQDSLGWVYYNAGRYEEAIDWLEQAVENVPDSAVLRVHLADAYRAHGEVDLALKQYMSARDLADDDLRETIQGKIDELQNVRPS